MVDVLMLVDNSPSLEFLYKGAVPIAVSLVAGSYWQGAWVCFSPFGASIGIAAFALKLIEKYNSDQAAELKIKMKKINQQFPYSTLLTTIAMIFASHLLQLDNIGKIAASIYGHLAYYSVANAQHEQILDHNKSHS